MRGLQLSSHRRPLLAATTTLPSTTALPPSTIPIAQRHQRPSQRQRPACTPSGLTCHTLHAGSGSCTCTNCPLHQHAQGVAARHSRTRHCLLGTWGLNGRRSDSTLGGPPPPPLPLPPHTTDHIATAWCPQHTASRATRPRGPRDSEAHDSATHTAHGTIPHTAHGAHTPTDSQRSVRELDTRLTTPSYKHNSAIPSTAAKGSRWLPESRDVSSVWRVAVGGCGARGRNEPCGCAGIRTRTVWTQ